VAYTPDGRRIASGSWDGSVHLWDAATGRSVAVLPQDGFVRALALSPDGRRLVAMGDGTDGLRVWDVAAGVHMKTYKIAENVLWTVAYRPDGSHIAVLGAGHIIEVLDAATGKRVATADAGKLEPAGRRALAYSPDGRLLAGPYEGNQIGLWEAETYRLVGTLTGHEGTVLSVAFSADGRRLASAGGENDSLIKVWDVASKDCQLTLRGHADEVFAAVFHPDGSRIASGGRDRLVRLWDAATGEELVRLPGHSDYVYSLAFSPTARPWCRARATRPCGCGTPSPCASVPRCAATPKCSGQKRSDSSAGCARRSTRPKHPGRKFEARYTLYPCHPRLVSGYKLGTNIKGSSYF
jgi:WD40 repeat protein